MMLHSFVGELLMPGLRNGLYMVPNTVPIVLPRHLVQDIDTEEDWQSAEWKFKAIRASGDD